MNEIVKSKSNAHVKQTIPINGKWTPMDQSRDDMMRTQNTDANANFSSDPELLYTSKNKHSNTLVVQTRDNSVKFIQDQNQNERFKNSPLRSMKKYPMHVMK